jgi:hypothetical protein
MWIVQSNQTACHWQEEDQLQLIYNNQSAHGNYDSKEQSAENLRVSENTLPLCFSSFQFLKRNSRPVENSDNKNFFDQSVEYAIKDMEAILNPESQPLTYINFQILDESLEPETNSELIHNNSVPLCFNSFQVLKDTLGQMLKDKYIKGQQISFESMQQSCQSFQDPIADRLDGLCGQNHSSFTSHEIKSCYDIDMIKQSVTGVCSAEVTLQIPSEQLQPCQEMHEDEDNIDTVPEMPSKNQGTCHFYLDLVATYMENFFTVEPQSFSGSTFVFQDCRGLYGKYQSLFQQWPFHFAVLSRWAKGQAALFTVLTSNQTVLWSQQLLGVKS